ncbi:MAG: CTP synthase [Chloroflexota bacterium]|nr:CTP synthase [Chloroflexota bacterium]
MTKFIFVTGGVVSSVGKGLTAASIGRILKSRGLSVAAIKLDPYLNVDPGTMSPYQHGEVFVTEDGEETDLDLGHYERFIDINLTSDSSATAGQVYSSVIGKERRGDFLGGTIQVVPHVTNEIKERIRRVATLSGADVVMVEAGGTVGDIEGLPFLEAIRQMPKDVGRDNVFYIHVTLLPHISWTGELKTKPTQHSVKELRAIGIQPGAIICRSDRLLTEEVKDKIALFCDVDREAVVSLPPVSTIYELPLVLEEAGLGNILMEKLGLPPRERDLNQWREMVERIKKPKQAVTIAMVGKYVELHDSYLSVREALNHAALYHDRDVRVLWVHSEDLEHHTDEALRSAQGIVVPGGFGHRGIEGMVVAARYARENRIPYLGLCLGMQVMVIELARHALGSSEVNSTEFDPETPYPVIDLMPDQIGVTAKGDTMRLGLYPCRLQAGTKAAAAYGKPQVYERHRHRYEFNNKFREPLESKGLVTSGLSPDGRLVEISELSDHPWMLGTQFHPEFASRPNRPHPLFCDFIRAAKDVVPMGGQRPLPL